jgi:hypothetical protein
MRLIGLLPVFLLFSLSLPAQRVQCLRGDGQHGFSVCIYESGAKVEGNYINGKLNGIGTIFFSNGDRYTGEWKDHIREGRGKMTFADGSEYEGMFSGNKFHGEGTLKFDNGDVFVGFFARDSLHGKGTYYKKNGWVVRGFWERNYLVEQHELALRDLDTTLLRNCKFNNCQQGLGWYRFKDNSRYVGTFKAGVPEGKGMVAYASGDIYEGGWKKDVPHGRGTMYYKGGGQLETNWYDGVAEEELSFGITPQQTTTVEYSPEIKIWTVIVGASDYSTMPKLPFTQNDASNYYEHRMSSAGGALPERQIKLLKGDEATYEKITAAMTELFLKADDNDVIELYFSGHGTPGSFLPINYQEPNKTLTHQEISAIMKLSRARHKLVIADACHAGAMAQVRGAQTIYQAFSQADPGFALLLSSQRDELSWENSELEGGVFSHFLRKGLQGPADRNGDAIVTIRELHDYVAERVRWYTGGIQTPVLEGIYDPNMPIGVVR